MLFVAGINKDFLLTAEGAEAQAARSSNQETKATFIKLARAYGQLAEQAGEHLSGFPSIHPKFTSLRLPKIWLGASFCSVPCNGSQFGLIQDLDWPRAGLMTPPDRKLQEPAQLPAPSKTQAASSEHPPSFVPSPIRQDGGSLLNDPRVAIAPKHQSS
jgi:hypothetical protein